MNVAGVTQETIIGLEWQDTGSNGGTTIIDYKIWYKHETDDADFSVLDDAIVG